jgi:hypothetical protein
MSHAATERYGLRSAPAGLALVQDLLNTRLTGAGGADLLENQDSAQLWASEAAEEWIAERGGQPPIIRLSDADVGMLRQLRNALEAIVAGGHTDPGVPPEHVLATLVPAPDGVVRLTPIGRDGAWIVSATWIEVFQAQQDGTWNRLKACRNPDCLTAFYDTSRNNSGVWHNVKTCGNLANLRASRERKRTQARSPHERGATSGS